MDWNKELYPENEKPLDRLVDGYSNTSIFRTIAFVGDSLSSGEFETRDADGNKGYHDLFEYSWGQYIARKNGLKAYNFSRGGMTAKEYVESYADLKGFWDREKACQCYVIALGVNDAIGKKMDVGSIYDADYDSRNTIAKCYSDIIRRYKEISPDAKFFFVCMPNENNPVNDDKVKAVNKMLYEFADFFENSYVIDLYKYGPVYDKKFKDNFFLYGHMNPMGYVFTARIIDSYIDYIIRHNPDDFKYTAFVGTDIKYIKE